MDVNAVLKAVSDSNRLKILEFLLGHNFCVGALANRLDISEAAVSQQLRSLREAGLVTACKRGYFTHYMVNREVLLEISTYFVSLSEIERKPCDPNEENCCEERRSKCHACERSVCPENRCKLCMERGFRLEDGNCPMRNGNTGCDKI